MRYLILALAGLFLAVPRAVRAEATGGYVACPLTAQLLGSDANGSCVRVTLGSGLTLTSGTLSSTATGGVSQTKIIAGIQAGIVAALTAASPGYTPPSTLAATIAAAMNATSP